MTALSLVILFFALYFIVKVMKSLVVNRAEIILDNVISKNPTLGLFAGLAFTIVVQSSSITTSLLIPLAAAGILTVEAVCFTLIARHFKRIVAHLVNIVTSVVLPLSDLDYFDEKKNKGEVRDNNGLFL